MRFVMLALCAAAVFSQDSGNASAKLLQDVAETTKKIKAWQIEGSLTEMVGAAKSVAQIKLLRRLPDETRFEQTGGSSPATIVCNGTTKSVFSPPLQRYRNEPDDHFCLPIIGEWQILPDKLHSPEFIGSCGSDPSIQSSRYRLVRGFSEPEIPSAGRITRTLCIDPERKLIVWERWASQYITRLYVYSTLRVTPEFPAGSFAFEPPPNSRASDFELPLPRPLGSRGLSIGPDISLPRLVRKKEPEYGKASRKAHIEGTVVLYVVIGANGKPSDLLVYRKVSPDLDKEAIRAVQQWRFTPGMKSGQPVALPVMIEVNFQMLKR